LRSDLTTRLEARRSEIEQAVLARVYAVSDPTDDGDSDYVIGLRGAVAAAVSYGLTAVGEGEPTAAIPPILGAQARHAARTGVSLDTVLRRYFAGYTLIGDFIMREAEAGGRLEPEGMHRLSRTQAALFDRLIVVVTEEYMRELGGRPRSTEQARVERVRGLLAGDLVEAADLGYPLELWHLGAIAAGPGAGQALREVAADLDRRLLAVAPGAGIVWAWLGGRERISAEQAASLGSPNWPEGVSVAVGEPAFGAAGWRLTHRQAQAAAPVGERLSRSVVRYADVALLASVMRDDVLCSSMSDIYLTPLTRERDGGCALRETLRAYFGSGRQVSSAAAALAISRQTVNSRLRTVEERIGRPLDSCTLEVEVALRLWDLTNGQTH
jgi:hypothetical protein